MEVAPFDPLFKAYLRKVYELVNLAQPLYLRVSARPDKHLLEQ